MSKDEKELGKAEVEPPLEFKPTSGLPYLQQLAQKMKGHKLIQPLESEEINRAMWVVVTSNEVSAIQQSIDCLWTLTQFGDIRRFSALDLACLQTALDKTMNQAENKEMVNDIFTTVYKLGDVICCINAFSQEPRRLSIPSLENVLLQLLTANVNAVMKKKVLLAVGKVIQEGYYRDSLKKKLQPHWQGIVQQLVLEASSLTLADIAHTLYACMLLGSLKQHSSSEHKPDDEFASAIQKLIDVFHEKIPITMPIQLDSLEFNQIIPHIQQVAEYMDYKHYQEGEQFERNKNNLTLRFKLQEYLDKRRPTLQPDSLPGKTFLKLRKKLQEDPRTRNRVICTAERPMGAYYLDICAEFPEAKWGEKRFFNVEYDGRQLHYIYHKIRNEWRLRTPYFRRRSILLGSPWNQLIDIKHYPITPDDIKNVEKISDEHSDEIYSLFLKLVLEFATQKQPEEKQLSPIQKQAEIKIQVDEELIEEKSTDNAIGNSPPIKLECSCCRCKTSINDEELLALAEQGIPQAQYLLAKKYFYSEHRSTKLDEMISWLGKAVASEFADAEMLLSHCYENGIGVRKDYNEAIKLQQLAAEHGDIAAQVLLARNYRFGNFGLKEDPVEAIKWYRKAANQGNEDALTDLGICYQNGIGVSKDPIEAVKFFREAAKKRFPEAQCRLGECYQYGVGVRQDKYKAVSWFRKAAKNRHPFAQNNLGGCYQYGIGVGKDKIKAIQWYRASADQGLGRAQNNLGVMYLENGDSDPIAAFNWLQKAAQCSDLKVVEAAKENLYSAAQHFRTGRNARTKKSIHSAIICLHAAALLDEQKQTIRQDVDTILTALLQDCYDAVEAYMSKKSSLGLDVYPHAALDFLLLIHSTAIAINNNSLRKKSAATAVQLAKKLSQEAGQDEIKAKYYENIAYLSDEKNNQETETHLPWLVRSFNSFNTIAVYPERWNIGQRLFELSQKCEILYKVKPTSAIKDQLFYIQVISLSAAAVKGHEKAKTHFKKCLSENLEACYAAAQVYENGSLGLALDGNILKNVYSSIISKASDPLKSKVIADAKRVFSVPVPVLKKDTPKIPVSLLTLYYDEFKQAPPDRQESIANDVLSFIEENWEAFISSMKHADFFNELDRFGALIYISGSQKIKSKIDKIFEKSSSELPSNIASISRSAALPVSAVDSKPLSGTSPSIVRLLIEVSDIYHRPPAKRTQQSSSDGSSPVLNSNSLPFR